jgi:nucleoid-associated protein YgaU
MIAQYEGRHSLAIIPLDTPFMRPTGGGKPKRYTVKAGDTLSSIASQFDLEGGWKALYEKNLWILGGNPNDLLPGQRLAL